MAAIKISAVPLVLKASALEDLSSKVTSLQANPSTSLPTPPKTHIQRPSQAIFTKLLSWRNPLFEAPRLLGQSKYSALERAALRSQPAVFTPDYLRTAMAEFEQRLVGQSGTQQRLPSLHIEDTLDIDVDRMEDTEMTTSPGTPRHGSTSNSALLSPYNPADSADSQQQRIHPFLRSNNAVSQSTVLPPVSTTIEDRQNSPMSPSTSSSMGILAHMRQPRVSRLATDQEMLNAPDYMMPLPDTYFPNHPMVSQNEVGNATNALFQHMKQRFNLNQEASRGVKDIVEGRTLPPPLPEVSHQQSLPHRGREDPRLPPHFQPPEHQRHTQPSTLTEVLEQSERNAAVKFEVRQLDGISFHRVTQHPFANELRAHYAAIDKSRQGGRVISMYKTQIMPPQTPRSNYQRQLETQSEMWYFFEIKTPQTATQSESCVMLAIPASELDENKAEECPMFRGGVQINARRREYCVKPFGRFRLECVGTGGDMQVLEIGIRKDLEDGSCRLFTWTEV